MPSIDLAASDIRALTSVEAQTEYYDAGFHSPGSFGVRINQGGRRSFFLIVRTGGRRRRVTLGHFPILSVERAREMAAEYLVQAGAGKDPVALYSALGRPVFFSDLVQRYTEVELQNLSAASTRREYSRIISRELLPVLGNFRLSAVGSSELRRLVDAVAGERGSPIMAQRAAAVLRRIFNFGLEKGFVDRTPFEQFHLFAKDDELVASPSNPRFLPPNDIKLLWAAIEAERPMISAIFRLILMTGQRPGDVLALRWEELNGEEWLPASRRKRKAASVEIEPVYLSPQVQLILREIPGYGAAVGTVFARDGGRSIQHIRKAAERIRVRAGLKERLSPIDLRRTAEYGMRSIGIRPDIVDRALGRKIPIRKNAGVFIGYDYTGDLRGAFRSWSQYVWKLVNPSPFSPDLKPGGKGPAGKHEGQDKKGKETGKVIQLFR